MNEFMTSAAESRRREASSPLNFDWPEDVLFGGNIDDNFLTRVDNAPGQMRPANNEPFVPPVSNLPYPSGSNDLLLSTADGKEESGSSDRNTAKRSSSQSGSMPTSRRKKKPKGMPKRPLSAYNLYFQAQRAGILARDESEDGCKKIGFEGLGKIIGKQWKGLSEKDRKKYHKLAEKESVRYRNEMEVYNQQKAKKLEKEEKKADSSMDFTSDPNESLKMEEIHLPNLNTFQSKETIETTSRATGPSERDGMQFPQAALLSSFQQTTSSAFVMPPPMPAELVSINQGRSHLHDVQQTPSFSPPPPRKPSIDSNKMLLPPAMEIILSDKDGKERKYCVEYKCYSMPREEAHQFIQSMTREE